MSVVQKIKQRFGVIGNSILLDRCLMKANQVSQTEISVLITGESGTGKENIPKNMKIPMPHIVSITSETTWKQLRTLTVTNPSGPNGLGSLPVFLDYLVDVCSRTA